MCFLDLIVGDVRAAPACLGHVDFAQLERRICRIVRGLMLQAESFDLGVETRQVFEKLFDHDRIEMNSGAAQQ